MVGFTEAEVRRMVETYRDHGVFNQDVDSAMAVMGEWYNGYRFATAAETDLYNTDMVLYYLDESMPNRDVPEYLIDTNVRIDYGKLRHLLVVDRQLNGNFDLLRDVIGEERADTRIVPGFPLKDLTRPENFLSLMHYFGLLGIRGVQGVMSRLAIPNQTVKRLMCGFLRLPDRVEVPEAFRDARRGRGRRDGGGREGAARTLPGGRAPGAAVSGRALHRAGRGAPRLGAGVLRRGSAITPCSD